MHKRDYKKDVVYGVVCSGNPHKPVGPDTPAKVVLSSKRAARKWAARKASTAKGVYKCEACGYWHTFTRMKDRPAQLRTKTLRFPSGGSVEISTTKTGNELKSVPEYDLYDLVNEDVAFMTEYKAEWRG